MRYLLLTASSALLACCTLVIGVRNPIHSILFLILVFLNGSVILMALHVEFFALIFLVIYVGAIVILFLFMVMMLNIRYVNMIQRLADFFPYASFIVGLLAMELLAYNKYLGLGLVNFYSASLAAIPLNWDDTLFSLISGSSNIESLGKILYSTYLFPFLEAGFILFLAMVGAIVIALDSKASWGNVIKKFQDPINQTMRDSANALYFSLTVSLKYDKNKVGTALYFYTNMWQNNLMKTFIEEYCLAQYLEKNKKKI